MNTTPDLPVMRNESMEIQSRDNSCEPDVIDVTPCSRSSSCNENSSEATHAVGVQLNFPSPSLLDDSYSTADTRNDAKTVVELRIQNDEMEIIAQDDIVDVTNMTQGDLFSNESINDSRTLKGGQDTNALSVVVGQGPTKVHISANSSFDDAKHEYSLNGPNCADFFDEHTALIRKGLRNLGNTCFINSVLQMIFSLENGFVNDLLHPCGGCGGCAGCKMARIKSTTLLTTPTSVLSVPCESFEIKRVDSNASLGKQAVVLPKNNVEQDTSSVEPETSFMCCDSSMFDFDIIKVCWPTYDSELFEEDGETQAKKLHDALVYIGQKLLDSDTGGYEVDPTPIKRAIDSKTDQFAGYQQHDSHEFMTTMLDILSEEQEQHHSPEVSETETNEYLRRALPLDKRSLSFAPTNVVDLHFCSEILVTFTCTDCQAQRSKRETFRHISLGLDSITSYSVEEAFNDYFKPEKRDICCERCGCDTAIETMKFSRLPNALLLHLKRFIVDLSPNFLLSYKKNNAKVLFHEELDLTPYCAPNCVSGLPNEESPIISQCPVIDTDVFCNSFAADVEQPTGELNAKFKLKSSIHHIGANASRGHYSADVLTRNRDHDLWMRCSDSVVTPCSDIGNTILGEQSQQRVYMLMYELVV